MYIIASMWLLHFGLGKRLFAPKYDYVLMFTQDLSLFAFGILQYTPNASLTEISHAMLMFCRGNYSPLSMLLGHIFERFSESF